VFESIRGTSDYLEPGYHRNVVVHLDDELTEDDSLFGMAHQDTNGNEAYDFPDSEGEEDGPYTADGDIAMDDGAITVSGAVDVSAQSSDGRTVVIDTVELSEGGFVTVHDSTLLNGAVFDSVLGTSEYLEAGHHHDVEVTLDSPISETQTLFGMAHQDTNGNEAYDFVDSEGDADGPVTANGDIVMESAEVSVPASVTIADQSSEGETVVVEEVTLHDGGFVTIHDGSLLEGAVFDSVRGSSEYLAPGTHTDVEITLDAAYEGDGTVIAMPHTDSNGNEAYDFVDAEGAADGPYVAAGGAVVHAASLSVDEGDSMDDGSDAQTTEETMSDGDDDEMAAGEGATDDGAESDGQPGFGVALAVLAVLGSVLLLRRRT
jgi:PGF-CTERM protein